MGRRISFRRRRVIVAAALVGPWLAFGSLRGEGDHLVLDWRNPPLARTSELEVAYPRAWHATTQNGRDLIVSSFPVSRKWLHAERRSLPSKGIFIWAFTYGRLPQRYDATFPARPVHLELDRKTLAFYSCGFNLGGYMLRFREHGLAVQIMVALGRGADEQAAVAVINRLRVS
jgi:hypothetical protein